jgi:hypothetical protein
MRPSAYRATTLFNGASFEKPKLFDDSSSVLSVGLVNQPIIALPAYNFPLHPSCFACKVLLIGRALDCPMVVKSIANITERGCDEFC